MGSGSGMRAIGPREGSDLQARQPCDECLLTQS